MLRMCSLVIISLFFLSVPMAVAGPRAVAVEPVKDLGKVWKGDNAAHDFAIRNDGDEVLQLFDVRPACGCVVAQFDRMIQPGETGTIHTWMNTSSLMGPVSKGLTVITNDSSNPTITLSIRATVGTLLTVKPGYARFIVVRGEPSKGEITQLLSSGDGSSFEVLGVTSGIPQLHVQYREATDSERDPNMPGTQWILTMSLAPDAPVGPINDAVRVTTNHPRQPMIEIPVSGLVRPVVAVTPPIADFGRVRLQEPLQKRLSIRFFATEPIAVTNVETDVEGIEAVLKPIQDGRDYEIRLTLTTALQQGRFSGKVIVRTDSDKVPVIEIPIGGTVE